MVREITLALHNMKYFLIEKFLGKKLYNEMISWLNKTHSWKKSDWESYWIKKLENLLRYNHNRMRYPTVDPNNYMTIFNNKPTFDFPTEIKFLSLSTEHTTGTTGRSKVVSLSYEDVITGIRTTRGYIEQDCYQNIVFVSSGIVGGKIPTSYNRMEMVSRIFRSGGNRAVHIPIDAIYNDSYKRILRKYMKENKIGVISALTGQYMYVLRRLEDNLSETLKIAPSGSILTKAYVKILKEKLSRRGINITKILNYYIATEVPGAIGWSKGDDYIPITIDPTSNIPGLVPISFRYDDMEISSKVYPVWKSKKGSMGFFAPTLLRTILVLNYVGLKDIIEVYDPNSWPPKIIHKGRWEHQMNISIPGLGTVSGKTGGTLRVAGMPFDMEKIYEYFSHKIGGRIFIRILDRTFTAKMIIYYEKPNAKLPSVHEIVSELQKDISTHPVSQLLKLGTLEIEYIEAKDIIETVYESKTNFKRVYWIVEVL